MNENEIIRSDAPVDMRLVRDESGTVTLTAQQDGGTLVLTFDRDVWADFRKRVRKFGR